MACWGFSEKVFKSNEVFWAVDGSQSTGQVFIVMCKNCMQKVVVLGKAYLNVT